MIEMFKFKPQEWVKIKILDGHAGRVNRCILDGGPQPIYCVHYISCDDGKSLEFYEDELEKLE